jgi:hypothetical protein
VQILGQGQTADPCTDDENGEMGHAVYLAVGY